MNSYSLNKTNLLYDLLFSFGVADKSFLSHTTLVSVFTTNPVNVVPYHLKPEFLTVRVQSEQ